MSDKCIPPSSDLFAEKRKGAYFVRRWEDDEALGREWEGERGGFGGLRSCAGSDGRSATFWSILRKWPPRQQGGMRSVDGMRGAMGG